MKTSGKCKNFLERLKKIECSDATYKPVESPLVIKSASGSIIVDSDDNEYIDFCAGFGVTAFGHSPDYLKKLFLSLPPIVHGLGDVYPSEEKILLIESLLEVLPDKFSKVALALSGAGAVETAIKTAILKTKSTGFICFDDSYHGVDFGTLPLTFRDDFKNPFENYVKSGNVISLPFNCSIESIRLAIAELEDKFGCAAIIVEPIQGRGGIVQAEPRFLKDLRIASLEAGALLIYDEIFCGLGRSGRYSFSEEFPCDLVCLGKALGGGFPLSACVGTDDAMSGWPESKGEAIHTGTFFGHPLSCRAARLTLEKMKTDDVCSAVLEKGDEFFGILSNLLESKASVKEIRGRGFMIGIVLKDPGKAVEIFDQARIRGLVVLPSGPMGDIISLTPALNCPANLLKSGAKILSDLL
jgi:acetylornithine/succinyldiaminopimelate/putrescine aminotransferase